MMHAEHVLTMLQRPRPWETRRVEVVEAELNRLIGVEIAARALVEGWGDSGPNRRARLWAELTRAIDEVGDV